MFAQRTQWDLRPNRLAAAVAARTRPFTDLTVSNPSAVELVYPAAEILAALARPEALRYQPDPRGLLAARAAVAGYYAERGAALMPERLLLTAGSSEAYSHLFRLLCDPGDQVLVPRPSYPLLDLLASLGDVELGRYPLWYEQGWQVDLAELERALSPRARAVVVIHPNNPTGSYASAAEWRALAELAAGRHLALIVDEVFFDFPWPGAPPPPQPYLAADYAAPLVFVLNGLSKLCGLPQAKLGWIAIGGADASLRQQALERLELINDSFLSVATAVQWALPRLLALRRQIQPAIRARLAANLAALDVRLARQASHQQWASRLRAEGGWSAVLRLPNWRGDEAWAEALLAAGDVLIHPGHFYEFSRETAAVLSLLPEPAAFAAGAERLLAAVAALAP